ncbi:MAG TPA: hypothetical protein VF533_06545 [Solirubrobacteraceae bacterium]|jgi:hypothetical protein
MSTAASLPVLDARASVWPVAAAALPVGFVIAQASGVRPLGGAVMVALLGACAWRRRGAGPLALGTVGAVAVGAFVASHLLHDALTVPGAVALAGAAVGAAAYALLDR